MAEDDVLAMVWVKRSRQCQAVTGSRYRPKAVPGSVPAMNAS